MPNINFELNLNKHPKSTPNRALIDAKNVQLSNDLSCLQSEFSITGRDDLDAILSDKYIAGYIPCNKEFILFLAPKDYKTQLDEHPEGIQIEIYRYKEKGDDAVDSFDYAEGKTVYNKFVWHGGELKGTFTYNIKSHLIVAVAESNTYTGDLIPLKTINLGTYDSNENDIDTDLSLEDGQLSLNPEVEIPSIANYEYGQGLAYKGWYYFFIRYKINSIDYTKWYNVGFPILIDDIEKYTLFNYNINGVLDDGENIQGYTSIVNQLSSGSNTCSTSIKLILDNFSTNFNNYQLGFICVTKDSQRAFKSLDINTNTKEIFIDFSSFEEYNVNDLTFEKYNYYDVKNAINYKNRLYISNYKESKFDKNKLIDFANNHIALRCKSHRLAFYDEFTIPDEEGSSSYINSAFPMYFQAVSESDTISIINCYPEEFYNCDDNPIEEGDISHPKYHKMQGSINLQSVTNWICKCIFYIGGYSYQTRTPKTKRLVTKSIDGINRQVLELHYEFYNHSCDVDVVCVERISDEEPYYTFPDGTVGDELYYYSIVYHYQSISTNSVKRFSSRNIIPSFKSRLQDRVLVTGGYYKFYIHFVNKYGEYSDGIPIKRRGGTGFKDSSNFDYERLDDDYLFVVPDNLVDTIDFYIIRKLDVLINNANLDLDLNEIKGFFLSYEKYSDINDFYGILTSYDFKKDNSRDPLPNNFINYSNQTNGYIYRFYCDEIDASTILELKSSKLRVYTSNFNIISNKYDTTNNDKLFKNNIYEDKHTSDLLDIRYRYSYEFNITSIKYVSAHSFIKDNDYRGSYLELILDSPVDELVNNKIMFAKLFSNDKSLYNSENKTLIKFTNTFYFEDIYNTEPVSENIYLIDENKVSKGLNGFLTFGKALIYNNDKAILNTSFNVFVNSKYNAYIGSNSLTEDTSGKVNNSNKYLFVAQYSFPITKEYMLETRQFKTVPEIIITRNQRLSDSVSQAAFDFASSTIVQPMNSIDLYKLPIGSQDTNNPKTYINFIEQFIDKFDKRVIRSNPIADESFENSWRIFSPEAYKDITENKGNITNIIALGTTLLVHTEHGLFMFDRDNTLQNGDGSTMQLAMPDIFDVDYKEVIASELGNCGLQDNKAWILDEFGYIFYDNDAHRFYRFGSKKIEIIDESIEQFINKYKPYQVRFINDSESNRILVNIRYNISSNDTSNYSTRWISKEITLSYNTKINKWISSHIYCFDRGFNTKQMTYFIMDKLENDKNLISSIYVINRQIISHQNADAIVNGNYSQFENVRDSNKLLIYPSSISIIVNDAYELIKTLEYISWKLYKIELSSPLDTKFGVDPRETIKIPYSGDTLRVYNDNIDTSTIDITVDTESKKNTSVMNYKKPWWQYDNWNFNYLRNIKNIEELKAKFMSRLYGNYFIITITFSDSVRRIEFETLDCKLINNRTI